MTETKRADERLAEMVERWAAQGEQMGKSEYEEGFNEAHTCCAEDLRPLLTELSRTRKELSEAREVIQGLVHWRDEWQAADLAIQEGDEDQLARFQKANRNLRQVKAKASRFLEVRCRRDSSAKERA